MEVDSVGFSVARDDCQNVKGSHGSPRVPDCQVDQILHRSLTLQILLVRQDLQRQL